MTSSLLIDCLLEDIRHLRTGYQCELPEQETPRTIKDFTHMKGAVKLELCISSYKDVKVTHVSGDTWGVYGMGKNEMIGRNILKIGKMSADYILRVFDELQKTGIVFKEIQFKGKKVTSILMHRDANNLVEISFSKEALCER